MDRETARRLRTDPGLFQREIYVPIDGRNVKFGDVMQPFQAERFRAINPSLLAIARGERPPIQRVLDIRTKGSSKDTDAAVNLLFLIMYSPRTIRIQCGAHDKDQADEVRQILQQILRIDAPINQALAQLVKVKMNRVTNERTGSVIEILTKDSLGGHGSRPNVLLVNELSHIGDREFASTLMDNADKMPNGLVIIASNAGHIGSWQHEWVQSFRDSGRWLIQEYNTPAPWISEDALEESRRRNSKNRFARLWQGEWVSDSCDAIDESDLQAAITLDGPSLPTEGEVVIGALDVGLSRDASAFIVLAKSIGYHDEVEIPPRLTPRQEMLIDAGILEMPPSKYVQRGAEGTGRLRLLDLRIWKPTNGQRVSIDGILKTIKRLDEKHHFACVGFDPWQSELLGEQLEQENIPTERVPFTGPNLRSMCSAVLEAFREKLIDLYDHEDLIKDIRALRIEEKSYGARLSAPRTLTEGHADSATALSIACHVANNITDVAPSYVEGPLICWP